MNPRLLTNHLTKKRARNQSSWLIGQHDVGLEPIPDGVRAGSYRVSARGFNYTNTKAARVESAGADWIALWMTGRVDVHGLFLRQAFFPMAGAQNH